MLSSCVEEAVRSDWPRPTTCRRCASARPPPQWPLLFPFQPCQHCQFFQVLSHRLGRRPPKNNSPAQKFFLGENPRLSAKNDSWSNHGMVAHANLTAKNRTITHGTGT